MSIPTSSDPPHSSKKLIETSYDIIAPTYLEWTLGTPSARESHNEQLISLLPQSPRPSILELGCGAGRPSTEYLSQHADVTGNDISSAQLELARRHVPGARFIHADMMALSFDAGSFDAVVAFFSVIHLPRDEQAEMMRRLFTWTKAGGYVLVNLGVEESDGQKGGEFLGAPMYWSGWDEGRNLEMIKDAGWEVVQAKVIDQLERGHGGGEDRMIPFLWVLGRRVGSDMSL